MELKDLATALGIETYPNALEKVYENLSENDQLICDLDFIKALHEKYDLLGDYYDIVIEGAKDLSGKKNLLTWATLTYAYRKDVSRFEAKKMPLPQSDGSPAGEMFPVLVVIREVPDMVNRYRSRGLNQAQIKKNLENIRINLWVHKITQGTVSLNKSLFDWLMLYTKALIFDHKGFNYQPTVWEYNSMVLKNKKTAEHVIVMINGRFAKNGLILGSAGVQDEKGAFGAEFNEFPDCFFGHRSTNGRVQPTLEKFEKTEWKAVLRPGDDVVALHIPRNTNLDPDYVSESFEEGLALAKKFYPELSPKCIVCHSWLMDPMLADILGPDAKLSKFTTRFMKHPTMDASGAGCLGYVWPGEKAPVETYSEKTTLQRGIKKLMLEGDFIRNTTGVITNDL